MVRRLLFLNAGLYVCEQLQTAYGLPESFEQVGDFDRRTGFTLVPLRRK